MRDKIVTQVLADLAGITVAAGYNHTVRLVEELRDAMPSSPTTPCIYFIEGIERASETGAIGFSSKKLNFGITFVVRDNTEPGQTARKMIEDVIKAVSTEFTITDSASNVIPIQTAEQSNMYIFEKRTGLIHAGIEFNATYKHALGDSTKAEV
jgi:hypothetical protein